MKIQSRKCSKDQKNNSSNSKTTMSKRRIDLKEEYKRRKRDHRKDIIKW